MTDNEGCLVLRIVFREDDEKKYNDYIDQNGCRADYEEEINQLKWW